MWLPDRLFRSSHSSGNRALPSTLQLVSGLRIEQDVPDIRRSFSHFLIIVLFHKYRKEVEGGKTKRTRR